MQGLRDRHARDGRSLGQGVLKVDSFINHQVDVTLMTFVGHERAQRFAHLGASKVLSAEISAIAPAVSTALALSVPVAYARKTRPITMPKQVYRAGAPSHTKARFVELMVSPEVLQPIGRTCPATCWLASPAASYTRLLE